MKVLMIQLILLFLIIYGRSLWRLTTRKKSELKEARRLQTYLSRCLQAELDGEDIVPKFKFYTTLVRSLLDLRRVYGAQIEKSIMELRVSLNEDITLEIKIQDELLSGFVQMLVMSAMTWLLYFMASWSVGGSSNHSILFIVFFLQVLGLIVFYLIFNLLQKRTFYPFSIIFKGLISFKSLLGTPLGTQEILRLSEAEKMTELRANCKNNELTYLVGDLLRLISEWMSSGKPLKKELDLSLGELQFLQLHENKKFIKKIEFLKFFILSVFGLPAYIIALGGIFSKQLVF